MKKNSILYRENLITDSDIIQGNCLLNHALAGETLAADTLDFRVWSDTGSIKVDSDFLTSEEEELKTADDMVFRCMDFEPYDKFIPGSSLIYKYDDEVVGKFFLSDLKQTGKNTYDFSCVSAIGVLGETYHPGGIYTGETVGEVLEGLLEGLDYEVDPIIDEIKLYGWLPYDTKRNNLQQITIATATAIRTGSEGQMILTALNKNIKGTFDDKRVSVGAELLTDKPYSAIQIAEHYYQEIEDEIILFDEASIKTELLKFREPVHSLTLEGEGTLIEWGANYAIVECSGAVLLKGKKYLHTDRLVTMGDISGLPSDNIFKIDNATLITALNSSGVIQKLYEAYTKPKKINANAFCGLEKSGDVCEVVNPYSKELENAFLQKQDINISNSLMSYNDFVIDFLPSGAIVGYKNLVILTGSGTWSVPDISEMRIVLIGGGQGGQGGRSGSAGSTSSGEGGQGGLAGLPGKVLDIKINVTPFDNLNYECGVGGQGGTSNQDGQEGTDTTLDIYSSDAGAVMPHGYVDTLEANHFAMPGISGIAGGKGNPGGTNVIFRGVTYVPGAYGTDYTAGGGPAAGFNGHDGTKHRGGNGATPVDIDTIPTYGQSGDGGHGGGGGGGEADSWGGSGGAGGKGGNGGDGIILIYY